MIDEKEELIIDNVRDVLLMLNNKLNNLISRVDYLESEIKRLKE